MIEDPINWIELLPEKIYCRKCRKFFLEGYNIPGKKIYYCIDCFDKKNKDKYVYFKNEEIIIDSKFINSVYEDGMCLQSIPCQHSCYINLFNFENDEEFIKYYEKMKGNTMNFKNKYSTQFNIGIINGIQITKLKLINGNSSDYHFEKYFNKIPKIIPKEIIYISHGISIRVNEHFVDPREKTKI